MGVLDDAIRQHLELKRQRGADPDEIKREEDDALGKVVVTRRSAGEGGPPAEQVEDAHEPAVTDAASEPIAEQETMAFDPIEMEQAFDASVIDEGAADEAAEPAADEAELTAEREEDDQQVDVDAAEPLEDDEPVAEETVSEVSVGSDDASEADDEEPEFADESVQDAEVEHDELEETPDFLEDAPEHDKLWFEQKPPKDFDF